MFPSPTSPTSPQSARSGNAPRKSRPRQSCHDCFKAKVKCDKERPGCTRCVTIGRDCGYVDYDRDGNVVGSPDCERQPSELPWPAPGLDDFRPLDVAFASGQGWNLGSGMVDGGTAHSMPILDMARPAMNAGDPDVLTGAARQTEMTTPSAALLSARLAWQHLHPVDSVRFLGSQDTTLASAPQGIPWELGVGYGMPQHQPFAPSLNGLDMYHDFNPQTFGNLPAQVPCYQDASVAEDWQAQPNVCGCFSHCLKGLHRLEMVSMGGAGLLDFDGILTLNLEALTQCSTLLSCGACRQSSEPQTTAMLLATTLSRISSLYLDASCRLVPSSADADRAASTPLNSAGALGLGAFMPGENGEHDMPARTELLARHLVKLDKVCGMYVGAFNGLEDDNGVIGPMTTSLVDQLKALRGICDWTALLE